MTEAKYHKCDGRSVICPTLGKRLGDPHHKGLSLQRIMNFKTGADCDPLLVYKTTPKDPGLVLNFCPWCGEKLNRAYQKPMGAYRSKARGNAPPQAEKRAAG